MTLLRTDHPGQSVWSGAGDIDNRVKTLIDALRMPNASDNYANITPNADDDPIFCLLEDDKLLTGFSVETGRLLDVPASADQSFAHVLINVKIRLAQDQMPIG